MNQPNRSTSRRMRTSLPILVIVATLAGAVFAAKDAKDKANQTQWYVRPTAAEPSVRGVLADLGVNWVEFEYNLPGDSVAIFKFVARDEAGKIIPELSKLHEFSPLNGDNFGKVRLTRINPEPLTVGKPAKKVRWAKTVANTGPGLTEWLPEHYGGTRSLTSWMEGTSIDSPEHDREYVLWHVLTYAKGLTTIFENSPTAFRYEIRFTLRKLKDGERPGTHRFMDVKDEP